MANIRRPTFVDGEYYHIYNRGLDHRPTFTDARECIRAIDLMKFYRHKNIPLRYSQILNLPIEIRQEMLKNVFSSEKHVDIICYCIMPNHFHFLIRQISESGIPKFISNFSNAYTRYFNTKNDRSGPLFQGVFRGVHVETDEQLVHLSRYIHLNPVVSGLVHQEQQENYPWSSYKEYLSLENKGITSKEIVLAMFKGTTDYKQFLIDQIDYAKKLEAIKHLSFE